MTQAIHRITDSLNTLCGVNVYEVLEAHKAKLVPKICIHQTIWKNLTCSYDILDEIEKNFVSENYKFKSIIEKVTLIKALVSVLTNSELLSADSVDITLPSKNPKEKAISYNNIPLDDFISFLVNVLRIRLRSKGLKKMPTIEFSDTTTPHERLLITFEKLTKIYLEN